MRHRDGFLVFGGQLQNKTAAISDGRFSYFRVSWNLTTDWANSKAFEAPKVAFLPYFMSQNQRLNRRPGSIFKA
jgi:hypothetical protein